jgi:hypothetical protein
MEKNNKSVSAGSHLIQKVGYIFGKIYWSRVSVSALCMRPGNVRARMAAFRFSAAAPAHLRAPADQTVQSELDEV